MTDLFQDEAEAWDQRPVSAQISEGVFAAIEREVSLDASLTVMDFGAGTGRIAARIAPRVRALLAVDVSRSMLHGVRGRQRANTVSPEKAAANATEVMRGGTGASSHHRAEDEERQRAIGSPSAHACQTDLRWMSLYLGERRDAAWQTVMSMVANTAG